MTLYQSINARVHRVWGCNTSQLRLQPVSALEGWSRRRDAALAVCRSRVHLRRGVGYSGVGYPVKDSFLPYFNSDTRCDAANSVSDRNLLAMATVCAFLDDLMILRAIGSCENRETHW